MNAESGCFNQTRLEDRLCKICEEGFVEDEIHFCVCAQNIEKKEKTST